MFGWLKRALRNWLLRPYINISDDAGGGSLKGVNSTFSGNVSTINHSTGVIVYGDYVSDYNGMTHVDLILMRWLAGQKRQFGTVMLPFSYIAVAPGETTMWVSVVKGGEHFVIEDPTSLFPSDNLITKLRLLA